MSINVGSFQEKVDLQLRSFQFHGRYFYEKNFLFVDLKAFTLGDTYFRRDLFWNGHFEGADRFLRKCIPDHLRNNIVESHLVEFRNIESEKSEYEIFFKKDVFLHYSQSLN